MNWIEEDSARCGQYFSAIVVPYQAGAAPERKACR